jgi:uncharacterized membrane protein HdeD (DUF308 family)
LIPKSKLLKNIKIIIGGIAIVFSGYRLFNITNVIPFSLTHPGIAVLVIGIVDIVKGILSKSDSKMTRTIEICIGIIAIIVGLFVMVYLTDVSSRTTWFIFIFVIIQGTGFILTGITQRGKAKAIRISKIVIGIIFVILTGFLLKYPDLALIILSGMLSVNLLLIGIELITGAISNKLAKS